MNRVTFVHIHTKLGQENLLRMVRWVRWHCHLDTGFEIQTLEVWGQARYLSVTEAHHNTMFYEWMGKKHLCFFQTTETGKRAPNSIAWKAAVLTTALGPPPFSYCDQYCRAKPKGSNCLLYKWTDTAFWLCRENLKTNKAITSTCPYT